MVEFMVGHAKEDGVFEPREMSQQALTDMDGTCRERIYQEIMLGTAR
jgi:hypothetical protein